MAQNYLMGEKGVKINAFMSAAAWNFKKLMEKLKEELFDFIFRLLYMTVFSLTQINSPQNLSK